MKKIYGANQEEKGVVLVISLLITVALLILIMPFLFKLSGEYRSTDRTFKSMAAINLAEAGVERAIWELNSGDISTWSGDSMARTLTLSSVQTSGGDVVGDIVISISNPESSSPVVESTGKIPYRNSDTLDRILSVELAKDQEPIFDNALFANTGINMKGNSFVDSFDSRVGIYGGDNIGEEGHIATNATNIGAITLENNVVVYGDAKNGEGGDPDDILLFNSSVVTGDKAALSESKPLPPIPTPEGLVSRGSYFLGGNDQSTISESGEYTSFQVDSNAIVTIQGDITLYVTGDFSMLSNTVLEIPEGSSLSLYLGGSFEQDSNTIFDNPTKDPTKIQIIGTDSFEGEMAWDSTSEFYGAVYFPQANVTINSNVDIYGSIIADLFYIDSNARIHYDLALRYVDALQLELATYYVKSWHEKLFP